MPHHKLTLKIGTSIILVRNNQASGLCNRTRLRATVLGKHFIKAVALNDTSISKKVLIHHMDTNPSDSKLPFQDESTTIPNNCVICNDNK